MNKTNAGILSGMFCRETDGWKGKEISVAKLLIKASDGPETFCIVAQRAREGRISAIHPSLSKLGYRDRPVTFHLYSSGAL
ncbi:MAG: hypothetical protein JRN37_09465 [Nitrososphaerota archaeon]|nr:hypothetical protein [Nitrososphaerota archaeon]MDG7039357.1 hypothetical protein [Nitrososphaerota archaeon]MDG7043042.1 hypothetical protein [Nitrososphaerota archaeon]